MATTEHFEIPVDNLDQAQIFYTSLLGWRFETDTYSDFEYTMVYTNDENKGIGGGIMERQSETQTITNHVSVESIEATYKQITELGGQVLMHKQEVEGIGSMAICMDTEKNTFGLWEQFPQT